MRVNDQGKKLKSMCGVYAKQVEIVVNECVDQVLWRESSRVSVIISVWGWSSFESIIFRFVRTTNMGSSLLLLLNRCSSESVIVGGEESSNNSTHSSL